MNLREDDRKLRIAAHGLLAVIALLMLGAGLALLSGARQGGRTAALVMVRPLPEPPPAAVPPAAPPVERLAVSPTRPPHVPPASEPPWHEGRPQPAGAPKARLAIVIDDLGHNLGETRRFLALGYPITYSILPDAPHSRESGKLVRAAGGDYIIHLPMQPFGYPRENPGPYPLLLPQSLPETAHRLAVYLHVLPEAIGASNHMGSAYTYNMARMRLVERTLAQHHLFFLNSRTSPTRVPAEIAHAKGYRYLARDVFLDNSLDERKIAAAFREAVHVALRNGHAIAIGHPHRQTLAVLKRLMPGLAHEDVEPVTLADLPQR